MTSKLRKRLLIAGVIILAVAFFSLGLTIAWDYLEDTQILLMTSEVIIEISNETKYDSPVKAFVNKGYFDSVGEVYAYLYSPYADSWVTFETWVSLDNSSWEFLPFLNAITSNRSQMANLGFISLSNPQLTVYLKHHIPPQTTTLPAGVTKEDASILTINVLVKRVTTPQDKTQWTIVFATVFATLLTIITIIWEVSKGNKKGKNKKKRRG